MTIKPYKKLIHISILELTFILSSTRTIVLIKGLMEDGKDIFGLRTTMKQYILGSRKTNNILFDTLVTPVTLYGC